MRWIAFVIVDRARDLNYFPFRQKKNLHAEITDFFSTLVPEHSPAQGGPHLDVLNYENKILC